MEWVSGVTRTMLKHVLSLGKTRHRVEYELEQVPQVVGPVGEIARLDREGYNDVDNAVLDDEEIELAIRSMTVFLPGQRWSMLGISTPTMLLIRMKNLSPVSLN